MLLNKIPPARWTNPWYLILCVAAGIVGMLDLVPKGGQKFRGDVLYQFMTCFLHCRGTRRSGVAAGSGCGVA